MQRAFTYTIHFAPVAVATGEGGEVTFFHCVYNYAVSLVPWGAGHRRQFPGDSLGWGGRQLPLPHHGQLWMTVEHLKPSVFEAGAVSAFCSLEQTSRSRLESLNHHAKTSGRGQGARERTLKTSMNRGDVGCLPEEASGGTGGPGNPGCQCALMD